MKNIKSKLIEVKKGVWVKKNAVIAIAIYPDGLILGGYGVDVDFINGQRHTYFFKTKKDAEKCVEKLR